MQKVILVSVDSYETRIAVLENSVLVEFYFERGDDKRLTGNIYKGRVTSVVEGIDAAFVDVGLDRNAFLFASDVLPPGSYDAFDLADDENLGGNEDSPIESESHLPPPTISDMLRLGQEVLVQVSKEPIGGKGSRVTTGLSLPGRYLVLLPTTDHIGVSRRINDTGERERLRKIAKGIIPGHMGLIIRTVAEGRTQEELETDLRFLINQWERIRRIGESCGAPALIHEEMVLTHRLVRDMVDADVDQIVVDSREMAETLADYMRSMVPDLAGRVKYHEGPVTLFKSWGVEVQLTTLRQKKVWLNCGGTIIIDETEALTAIDVNTGKFIGSRNLEDTVLATNLEAAAEISRQMRLRDIGGIVIVDFIDMQRPESRQLVIAKLEECLRRDRARTQILDLTRLGLVEMTRKRVRKSYNKMVSQCCPYCKGQGTILTGDTMMIEALRRLEDLCERSLMKEIRLYLHPRLASRIVEERNSDIERLEARYRKKIQVVPARNLHFEEIKDQFSYDTAEMLELT